MQSSRTVSRTPCHGVWTSAPLSTHLPSSANARRLKSRHPFVLAAQQLISLSEDNSRSAALWADHRWNAESWRALRDSVVSSPSHPHGMALPRTACVQLNRLCTGVRRFRSCLHKRGMTSSAACECGTEDQTVDHRCLPMSNPSTSPWSTA